MITECKAKVILNQKSGVFLQEQSFLLYKTAIGKTILFEEDALKEIGRHQKIPTRNS